ncbi:MAG: GDP-mannose 4,6-dehydratase [Actinomycetota bacterium]|nr:GDP-mannose 4,6-dehydratase [Actinomycetota bacterium]
MRALVTGAGGFVGPYLVAHLEQMGDEVVATDRQGDTPLDVVDSAATLATIAQRRPEVVYHLAAFAHVGDSWTAREEVLRVNVLGTANVLAAAVGVGVGRVVVVGSAEEYGRVTAAEVPLREDAPLRPASPYAASKVAAAYLALQAYLGDGLATVRVRPFNHVGAGQSDRYVVAALAARIAAAERADGDEVRVGSLDPVRDITDVRDVVRAYRALAVSGEPGEVYNVCTGTGVSVRDIAERLLQSANRPLRLVPDPELVRPVDVPCLVGDPTKVRAATGWAPERDLDTTLADVLDDARRRAR